MIDLWFQLWNSAMQNKHLLLIPLLLRQVDLQDDESYVQYCWLILLALPLQRPRFSCSQHYKVVLLVPSMDESAFGKVGNWLLLVMFENVALRSLDNKFTIFTEGNCINGTSSVVQILLNLCDRFLNSSRKAQNSSSSSQNFNRQLASIAAIPWKNLKKKNEINKN